jgi:rhamnogalacturonan endolyase
MIRTLLILIALLACVRANDAGGGAPGVGANVTLSTTATTATLSNGIIQAIIEKSTGRVTSYKLNGFQMVDPANPIYYSMDGGAAFEVPTNCVYSVTTQTADMVDVSFKRTWNNTSGYKHAFDIDLHFVLRRGDTGMYAYAILNHPASYPATSVGEWRIVWKLPRNSTTFAFERAYVDDLRNWEMPSVYDYQNSSPTAIGEIVKLNTGVMAGKYDGKYTYAARYSEIDTWGHASHIAKKGVWFVLGGHDYFNGGPTQQDLTSSESYILMHFGRNHFAGAGTSVAAGETWRKMYGPFLLYCNATTATSNAGDVLWADAKAQVAAEEAAWPYAWLTNSDHPAAASRGTVTGRLLVNDPLKPSISGANANIGLAASEETEKNWQFQSKGYQYWTKADASGNFTIPAVRPGTYTLYAFTDGVVGELSKLGVTVTAGGTNAQGDITWNVSHPGTSIAWEIGVPDRTAKEFKHGDDYFIPFMWNVYTQELPNPLVYNVGSSNPATDWNYAHSNYTGATAGTTGPWEWKVNFNLPAVPRSGTATLTVAVASANYPGLFLYLNDSPTSFARISPPVGGGNALLRQGIHAKYSYVDIAIPVSLLRTGANTFTFRFSGSNGFSPHVMYDYLRLELPDFPPPPPDSGRSIVWAGGTNAAANTWDNGTTNSFRLSGAATPFGTGDAVTFSDTGSNSTSVTLTGTLQANSVTFSGTKNYTLAGTGALNGPMSLLKSGTSTLTVSQANTFSGDTAINGGVISLSNDTANVSGLGSGNVSLNNGTLRMNSNGNSYNDAPWNLDVPSGATGTLEVDARCDLKGKLTGAGTFRYRLPSGAVRASILGDWSGFSGTVEATAISGSAEFRIAPDYNWPGLPAAALSLGNSISAYWSGNLNTGSGTFVTFGELSGTASSTLKGGAIGGRQITYRVGGRGTDATFAGTISEQTNGLTNLIKTGGGTWTLSGTGNVNGDLTVEAGTLAITGSFTQPSTKSTLVEDSAVLVLDGALVSGNLTVADGGKLAGQGSLNGALTNDGLVELSSGSFDISGAVTNNGYFRVKSSATFTATGGFINNGTLNLIGSTQPIPPGIVNNGLILTDRAPATITWTGSAGAAWDVQTSVNWTNSASQPDVFFPGDTVLFNDTASTSAIELSGTLTPASVSVTTSLAFSLNGGALGGAGGLAKSGSGSLTVSSALNFTGPVQVTGGKLALTDAVSWPAGSSLIQVAQGAILDLTALPSVTVAAGQTLRGAGAVQGTVTVNAAHDPGPGSSFTGSLSYGSTARVSWSLAANSTTAGTFDSIQAEAVTISAGAALDLVFNDSASGVNFSDSFWAAARSWTVLTSSARTGVFSIGNQTPDLSGRSSADYGTFAITESGNSLVLTWTPAEIVWRGTTNANWDLATANWQRVASVTAFRDGAATRIDDGTNVTSINLASSVSPGSMVFDSTKNYSIGGAGSINGAMVLEKKGAGTLTLSSANGFTGGTIISGGTVAITNAAALGTGPVTLAGGTWDIGTLAPENSVVLSANSSIIGRNTSGSQGIKVVSGTGVLTLSSANTFDLKGAMTSFSGTVRLIGTGNFRLNGTAGSDLASFDLGTRTLSARNGGTYKLGSLTGSAGSTLTIASYTSGVTFSIGANGQSSAFPGVISNGSGTTSVIKVGTGTLTLSGASTYSGSTSVNAGELSVTGSLGGTAVAVASGATLSGTGSIGGAVSVSGSLAPGPAAGTLSVASLQMNPSGAILMDVAPSGDRINVTGNLALAGSLQVNLASGVTFGRFPLLVHGGSRTGSIALSGVPSGTPAHLAYGANEVVLFIDDQDEDGLPDTWEQQNFGGLVQTAGSDYDGDGTADLVEYRLGLDPKSGTSAFRAVCSGHTLEWPSAPGIVFTVKRSVSLNPNQWDVIGTVTGGEESTSTFTDPDSFERAFYRIEFAP